MRLFNITLSSVLVLFLVACNNGSNETEDMNVTTQDEVNPAGIWLGTQTSHTENGVSIFDMRTLIHGGKFFGLSQEAGVIYAGTYDIKDGKYLTANGIEEDNTSYSLYHLQNGELFSRGSVGFEIQEKSTLNGNFENDVNQFGSINSFYSTLYENNSSLEMISLSYKTQDVNLSVDSSNGLFNGSLYGCVADGKIATIDTSKNMYEVTYELSDCNISGIYEGLGIVAVNNDTNISYFTSFATNEDKSRMELFSYYLLEVKDIDSSSENLLKATRNSDSNSRKVDYTQNFFTNHFNNISVPNSDFSNTILSLVEEKEICKSSYYGAYCQIKESKIFPSFTKSDFSDSNFSSSVLEGGTFKDSSFKNVDFSHADLSNTNFESSSIIGANLSYANLTKANLSDMNLSGVNLTGTTLIGVNFSGIDFSGRDFSNKDLTNADLSGTNLEGVNLKGTILKGAKLNNVDLSYKDLSGKDLSGTDLSGANLEGTNLSDTVLKGAIFKNVSILNIDFSGRDLSNIDFSNSDLSGANLSGTNIEKVNFSKAKLVGANLSNAGMKTVDRRCFFIYCDIYDTPNLPVIKYPNFEGADLSSAIGKDADFSGGSFKGSILLDSDFSGANFTKVNLKSSNLTRANFSNVNLQEVELQSSNLQETIFTSANFSNSTLKDISSIEGAVFSDASLKNIKFDTKTLELFSLNGNFLEKYSDITLTGSLKEISFSSNYFENVTFNKANFSGLDFNGFTLMNVTIDKDSFLDNINLKRANIINSTIESNFENVNAEGANFEGTTFLQHSNLDAKKYFYWNDTNLRNSNLAGAKYNEKEFSSNVLLSNQFAVTSLDLSGAWLTDRRCGPASYGGVCTPTITFGYSYEDYIQNKEEIDYILENLKDGVKDLAQEGKNWVEDTAENVKEEIIKYIPSPPKISWSW